MIKMNNFLRIFNGTLFCTGRGMKSVCAVAVPFNIYFRRPYTIKQRNLLSAVYAGTYIPTAKMSAVCSIKTTTYEYVKSLRDNKDVLLIDVREPSELKETGIIPGSINIPLGEVENVLKNGSPDGFAKQFGRPKPDINFPLVFSCRSGKRSENASKIATKLGYRDVTNYEGGWMDWEKKSQQ